MSGRIFLMSGWVFALLASAAVQSARAEPPPCPTDYSGATLTATRAGLLTYKNDANTLSAWFDRCFPQFIPACFGRIEKYPKGYGYGALDTPATEDPRRQIPAELVKSGNVRTGYVFRSDIEKVAKANGWTAVRYKTRLAGGFDTTGSLLMVMIPGDKAKPPVDYDRYVNYPLPADPQSRIDEPVPSTQFPTKKELTSVPGRKRGFFARLLSRRPNDYASAYNNAHAGTTTMVTIKRATDDKPAEVFFQKYHLTGARFVPQRAASVDSCYTCHPNGLRAISPLGYHVVEGEKQLPPDLWNATKKMNDAMDEATGGRPVSWRSGMNPRTGKEAKFVFPEAFGPIIGPVQMGSESRNQSAIQACVAYSRSRTVQDYRAVRNAPFTFRDDRPFNWEKVANAMNCAMCHSNHQRGALNSQTSWDMIELKVLLDRSMPHGSRKDPMALGDPSRAPEDQLNDNERFVLVNCLQKEFETARNNLDKWFTEEPCFDEAGPLQHFPDVIRPARTGQQTAPAPNAISSDPRATPPSTQPSNTPPPAGGAPANEAGNL